MTNQFFCNNQTNRPRITATKHWYFCRVMLRRTW